MAGLVVLLSVSIHIYYYATAGADQMFTYTRTQFSVMGIARAIELGVAAIAITVTSAYLWWMRRSKRKKSN